MTMLLTYTYILIYHICQMKYCLLVLVPYILPLTHATGLCGQGTPLFGCSLVEPGEPCNVCTCTLFPEDVGGCCYWCE